MSDPTAEDRAHVMRGVFAELDKVDAKIARFKEALTWIAAVYIPLAQPMSAESRHSHELLREVKRIANAVLKEGTDAT
jgi:hypothetical protein